jgi:Rrf2 family protein
MHLSQTSEHALRAVLYLAQASTDRRVPADEIARALDAPANYLSKTLNVLVKQGILGSVRGPHGGYWLRIPAEGITVSRLIRIFDAPRTNGVCLMGGRKCQDEDPCAAHLRWKAVASDGRALERTSIAHLLGQDDSGTPAAPSLPRDPPVGRRTAEPSPLNP